MIMLKDRSLLDALKRAVYPITSHYFSRYWVASGTLRDGGPELKILFVHDCLFNRNLQQRTFVSAVETKKRRVRLSKLPALIRENPDGVDFVCAVIPRSARIRFADLVYHVGREEVRQVISTNCDWEQLRTGFSRKRRQVTNDFPSKSGLTCRISNALEDFDHFYHRMHVPHIRRRYGELADIDSYEDMKAVFRRGLLVLVYSAETAVAGALSVLEGNTLMFRRSGVLDGDESHIRGGAQTALYYFQLRYAVDRGIAALDTMKSDPFLNDGVFKHKADWGARPQQDHEAQRAVLLFPIASSEKAARFFEINPLVIDAEGGLAALIGDSASGEDAPTSVGTFQQRYQTAGLDYLLVHTRAGHRVLSLVPTGTGEAVPATTPELR